MFYFLSLEILNLQSWKYISAINSRTDIKKLLNNLSNEKRRKKYETLIDIYNNANFKWGFEEMKFEDSITISAIDLHKN